MRIRRILIQRWRHFENLEIRVDPNANLIGLVGTNGSGKSQILELVAAAAQHIGISQGFDASRGNPFEEPASFLVEFQINLDDLENVAAEQLDQLAAYSSDQAWDGTLAATRSMFGTIVLAGGFSSLQESRIAGSAITNVIRQSEGVHYLMLDADRAYPKIQVHINELGSALETSWDETRKSRAHSGANALYQEWFRYLIGIENQENSNFIASVRRARELGAPDPTFVDSMSSYKGAVQKVLPHLLFTGVDTKTRQVKFDSTGLNLSFSQLSGGEREIAFLIGQIERFGLKHGLLLVDEPELHLNNEMVRNWIRFLQDSIQSGQVWLASHSLEVVEVVGRSATFLLERDEDRIVRTCSPLDARPIVSTLSRAIGSPAFAISGYAFVFVEGEEVLGERERFLDLVGGDDKRRILESGDCREVIRRVEQLRQMSEELDEPLSFGGVIDRDWRSSAECAQIEAMGLHVLRVHEVENFFLYPPVLDELSNRLSRTGGDGSSSLREIADRRAALWVFSSARAKPEFQSFPRINQTVREMLDALAWSDIEHSGDALNRTIDEYEGLTVEETATL